MLGGRRGRWKGEYLSEIAEFGRIGVKWQLSHWPQSPPIGVELHATESLSPCPREAILFGETIYQPGVLISLKAELPCSWDVALGFC